MTPVRVFIQARMSSSRFPGKVLAPFRGRPIIAHVISRIEAAVPLDQITVVSSTDPSDYPLACYLRELGVAVFRGPLDNVFQRFQMCLEDYPCQRLFRVSADSPLLDGEMIERMLDYSDRDELDLVTNVFPRTFPRGRSLEMLNSTTFSQLGPDQLTTDQKEHLTRVYYDDPARFRILNIESGDPAQARVNLSVDTVEDLRYLESVSDPVEDGRITTAAGQSEGT